MKTVKNIAKITKAMQMVAASKLKIAQERSQNSRHLSSALAGVMAKLVISPEAVAKSHLLIPICSDKGLCGGLNAAMTKMLKREIIPPLVEKGDQISIVLVGGKAKGPLRRELATTFQSALEHVFPANFAIASAISNEALASHSDEYVVSYNKFKSAISQIPMVINVPSHKMLNVGGDAFVNFEIEDERSDVLQNFAEFNLVMTTYGAMLENYCSEIASRMQAMDGATTNANKSFGKISLRYNKARQAAITTELTEIISGAESLKK